MKHILKPRLHTYSLADKMEHNKKSKSIKRSIKLYHISTYIKSQQCLQENKYYFNLLKRRKAKILDILEIKRSREKYTKKILYVLQKISKHMR